MVSRVLDLGRAGRVAEARDLYQRQGQPLADRLDRRVGELVHKTEAQTFDAIEANHFAAAASERLLAVLSAAAVLGAGIVGLALSLSIVRPLRRIGDELARIAVGDFSRRVTVDNRDELGALARSINQMNDELAALYRSAACLAGCRDLGQVRASAL